VLAGLDRGERQPDAGVRIARRFDHDLDPVGPDQRIGVVGDERAARPHGLLERARPVLRLGPARGGELRARAGHVQVGDRRDLQARGRAGLGQEHRPELAGAD
jgi:hypothetical protein